MEKNQRIIRKSEEFVTIAIHQPAPAETSRTTGALLLILTLALIALATLSNV